MLDNLVPPHMSLVPFKLLLWCWSSEAVSPSKSVHGPFKRNCLGFQQFLFSTASIPTGFYSQELWRLIFLALEPWTEEPVLDLGPLAPEISLPIFISHILVWDQPVPWLCPSYLSGCGFFFNSIVVGLPFSSLSDGY